MKKNLLGLSILLLLVVSKTYAQDNSMDILANSLKMLSTRIDSESIYLQTSKGIYETGEDIWFKGYVLQSSHLTPSLDSKILYVQLVEETTNKQVWEEKYTIKNGFVNGHVYLQDTLQAGNYNLIAYTHHTLYQDKNPIKSIRKLKIKQKITNIRTTQQDSLPKKSFNKHVK